LRTNSNFDKDHDPPDFWNPVGIEVPRYLIASAERIAVENKGFRGLGTKNGSYWKVLKDLVSRSGGLVFQSGGLAFQNQDRECIKYNLEREQDFVVVRMKAKLGRHGKILLLELPNTDEYREDILSFLAVDTILRRNLPFENMKEIKETLRKSSEGKVDFAYAIDNNVVPKRKFRKLPAIEV